MLVLAGVAIPTCSIPDVAAVGRIGLEVDPAGRVPIACTVATTALNHGTGRKLCLQDISIEAWRTRALGTTTRSTGAAKVPMAHNYLV